MPYDSLRDFLAKAEAEGQLLRIKEEIRPEPDIRRASCAAAKIQGGPVLLFEKIQGYRDKQVVMKSLMCLVILIQQLDIIRMSIWIPFLSRELCPQNGMCPRCFRYELT